MSQPLDIVKRMLLSDNQCTALLLHRP